MSERPLPTNRRVRRPAAAVSAPAEPFPEGDDESPRADAKTAAKAAPARPKGPSRWRQHLAKAGMVLRVVVGSALFVGTVAGASYGLYRYVSTTRRFAIKEIVVTGQKHRTDAEVARAGGLEMGKNLFTVDLDQARRTIAQDPWIEQAIVTRRLPSTVNVRVVEREPLCVVAMSGSLYLAAAGGEVFKRLEPGDPTDFVVVSGAFAEGEMVRDRAGVMALVKRAEDVIADYERAVTDKRFPLQEVHVNDEGGIELVVGREAVVLSLGKAPYRPKLERAGRVLAEIDRRKGQASIVFLDNDAHPERVVARLK